MDQVTGKTARSTSDSLSFKGSADFGGLELEITPTQVENAEGTLSLAKYNGWINFGDFMLKSGSWDARAVGRVNADIGSHEGGYWGEITKPGLAHKLGTSGNGVDISQQNGKKKITTMVQYTNKDLGLEVRGAFIDAKSGLDNTYSAKADNSDDWEFENNQWLLEAGYNVANFGRVMATLKTSYKDQAFALFVEPNKVVSGLTSLVGFTYEMNGDKDEASAFGIDLRARYAIDDKLSVTAMGNWTQGDSSNDKTKKVDAYSTWAMANATYKLNDTFQPFMSVVYTTGATENKDDAKNTIDYTFIGANSCKKDDAYSGNLRFFPGVSIYNTSAANIITGVVFDMYNFTGEDEESLYMVKVPVLIRVKF